MDEPLVVYEKTSYMFERSQLLSAAILQYIRLKERFFGPLKMSTL